MSRLIGPDESCRTVFLTSGTNAGKALAQGMSAPLYADAALTTPADVRSTTGDVIAGTPPTVTVNAYSQIPLIQYPDGVDTIYTSINGGPAVALYARTDDRLDALATAVAAAQSTADGAETPAGAQAKANAAQAAAINAAATDATTKAAAAQAAAVTAAATDATTKANAAQAAATTAAATDATTKANAAQAAAVTAAATDATTKANAAQSAATSAAAAALAAHEADTTNVHGIADTSLLRSFQAGAVIASMGTPLRTAHRCGGSANGTVPVGPVPENSLEGARVVVEAAQALNITNFIVNVQCRLLADGAVVAMHDSTWDRTTTTSGNVADYNAQAVAGLVMDAGTYTGATAFGNLKVPLLDDFLREFGGKVALNIAAYQGTAGIGQAVVNHVTRAGLQKTVMVSSFQTAELTAAKAAGIATMYYPPAEGNSGSTAAEILATDVWATGLPKYVGVDVTSTDAYLQGLVAAGLHVSVYFTDRRYERDYAVNTLGVHGLISDDPIYQFTDGRLHSGTVDPYTLGAWPHGALESDLSHGRGVLTSAGLKLDNLSNTQFCVDGSRCPIATPTAYTITGQLTFDTIAADTTRSAQLIICCPDDRVTSGVASSGAGLPDGYSLLFRANGNVELWKDTRVGQGNTKVGSTLSSTAATAGVATPFTVQVTATQIIFTRTDTAATITWTDSTYRGTYYHRGKNGGATTTNLGVTWKITGIA